MSRKASKTKLTHGPGTQTQQQQETPLPRIGPKHSLAPQPLYPEEEPTIFSISAVLTPSECQTLVAALSAAHPLQRVAHAQTRSVAWRDVDRVEFRSPRLSELMWAAGLAGAMEKVPLNPSLAWAGLNSKWRIYRYSEQQGFGPHFDEEDVDPLTQLHSHYTLLVYLSEVPTGGETVFYKSKGREVLAVQPAVGCALVHAQGHACLLHEGRPVGRGGVKWVLRSDVMVQPSVGQEPAG